MSLPTLTTLPSCPAPVASCAPVGLDLSSLHSSAVAMCGIIESLQTQVSGILLSTGNVSEIARLLRENNDLRIRVKRLEESAIVCISWNEDTCQIQGSTTTGTVKVFAPDPCTVDLTARVDVLDGDGQAISDLSSLLARMGAAETAVGLAIKTITVDPGCALSATTTDGAVTTIDVGACYPGSETLMQEMLTTGALDVSYDIPFTINNESLIDCYVVFSDNSPNAIYNFQIINSASVVVDSFTDDALGNVIIDTFHVSKTSESRLDPGQYILRVTDSVAAALDSLKLSIQIKSLR